MSQAAIADWPMRVAAPAPVPVSSPHAINLRGVSKSFGATTVLQGIDLTVDTGEFLAIVGRSGCGKTTLLRLLAGIEQPSAGLIDKGNAGIARMMFQDARLLPWRTVIDNVAIGRHGPGWQDEARTALALVGLEDKAAVWPATLSGGQRQRVALARALISRPRLLLLDEPLSALDALTRLEMQALIERIRAEQGFTAVLVTHDVAEAVNLADRVIVLEEGRIAETWHIPEPHPRTRSSGESAEIEARILARLLDRK